MKRLLRGFAYRLLAVSFACVALALAMAAQDVSKKQATHGQPSVEVKVERGEVVYVSGNDLVVKMENGEVRHVVVPDDRRITVEGRELSVHDLKPGMKLERTITTTTTPRVVTTVRTVEGTVWHVNPPHNVILRFPDGSTRKYNVPKDQKFMVEGKEKTVFDLKKGMEISATAITETPETEVSATRKVTGAMPPPPPTPAAQGVILFEVTPPLPAAAPPAEVAKAEPAPAPAPKKLPQTASPLPLMGLLGSLMLAAGFGLRTIRSHAR
jgi:hypothetical protein